MNTKKQVKNYIVRQNNWIKANDIKKGDTVLVLRSHENNSKGWQNHWEYLMNNAIGYTFQIINLFITGIHLKDNIYHFQYPYTVLVKVPDGTYSRKAFYDSKGILQYAIVNDTLMTTEVGNFGWQEDLGDGTSGLRKFELFEDQEYTYKTFQNKSYYPYQIEDSYTLALLPLVVASTLTGIGLPTVRF